MIPPSVVLVLYGMIARQPVGQLWMAGVLPGIMLAVMFIIYIIIRCFIQPQLGPAATKEERNIPWKQKFILLRSAILPILIIFLMSGLFFMGVTSLVESSAVGAIAITIIALINKRLTWKIMVEVLQDTLSVSCMFMWVILAALAFGAVFDGLGAVYAIEKPVPQLEPGPLGHHGHDAALLHHHGHVPGRHGHAHRRGSAVRAPGHQAGLQPDLVRGPVHDHLPDRLPDARPSGTTCS